MSVKTMIVTDNRPQNLDWEARKALHSKESCLYISSIGKHHSLKMHNQNIANNAMIKLPSGQMIRATKRNILLYSPNEPVDLIEEPPKSVHVLSGKHRKGKKMWFPDYVEPEKKSGTPVQKCNSGKSLIAFVNMSFKEVKEKISLPRRSSTITEKIVDGVKVVVITPKRYR